MLIGIKCRPALTLFWVYQKTAIGRSMRAVSYIPDAAALQGINVNRVFLTAMAIATWSLALLERFWRPTTAWDPLMGSNVIWTVMLINQLGGDGEFAGRSVVV